MLGRLAFAVCLLALCTFPMQAGIDQWTTTGPSAPQIDMIVVDPRSADTVYAIANRLLFRTSDGARFWQSINPSVGTDDDGVYGFAIDPSQPDRIYAGRAFGFLMRSDDGGRTWDNASQAIGRISGIVVAETGRLYFHNGESVYRSDDAGDHLAPLPGPWSAESPVTALAVAPSDPDAVYAGIDGGLFRSPDGGAHWLFAGLGLEGPAVQIVVDPATPTTLYAVTAAGVLAKSLNSGGIWFPIGPEPLIQTVAIDPGDSGKLVAGGREIFRSADGGATWVPQSLGLPLPGGLIRAFAFSPTEPGIQYAGSSWYGLFRSADGAQTWEARDEGFPSTWSESVAATPAPDATVYAASRFVYRRRGGSWRSVHPVEADSPYAARAVRIDPRDRHTVYAALGTCSSRPQLCGGGLYRSADEGISWDLLLSAAVVDVQVDPRDSSTLYAGLATLGDSPFPAGAPVIGAVMQSVDGGATWSRLNYPLAGAPKLVLDPVRAGTIYAATQLTGILRTADGGVSWETVRTGQVSSLALDNSGERLYAGTWDGVFRSTDGSASWEATGLTELVDAVLADPADSRIVYAGTRGGVWRSIDAGATWGPMGDPSPGYVQALALDPAAENLYAATSQGVFQRQIRRPTRTVAPR